MNLIDNVKRSATIGLFSCCLLINCSLASADQIAKLEKAVAQQQTNIDFVWVLVAIALVFIMQAGFTCLETGLTRSKNAVNITMKNLLDICAGGIAFFLIGFGIMFGSSIGGFVGADSFMLAGLPEDNWNYAFFLFQAVFAATAATIVSGAIAERTRFSAYVVFSIAMTAIIYPVFGSWAWGSLFRGSGWLEGLGFIDFAGSTVVHSVGGWAALAACLVVGPRIGRYDANGNVQDIPGHSLPLASLGVFILWMGWFGFNAGSTTAGTSDIALIAINTFLSACAGGIVGMLMSWVRQGSSCPLQTMNGILGGLVAITAGCANLSPITALVAGAVAGVIIVYVGPQIDRYVDDAVGAICVHGVCGAWGTVAAGIFNAQDPFNPSIIAVQVLGVVAAFLWAFPTSLITLYAVKKTFGVRVSEAEELEGLDLKEHGKEAYFEQATQILQTIEPSQSSTVYRTTGKVSSEERPST